MNKQYKNEILKFEANVPVSVTLDTEPSEAKATTRDTQWGKKTSFTYFLKEGKVTFASEALHSKLSQFRKGDLVTVNLVDGKIWQVSGNSQGSNQSTTPSDPLLTKVMFELTSINTKLDEVIKYIHGDKEIKFPDFNEEESEEVNDTGL